MKIQGAPGLGKPALMLECMEAVSLCPETLMSSVDVAQNTLVAESTKVVFACLHNAPDKIPLVTAFLG